ncbi:MAG: esterase-like activity of phytase family protein [Hyphomonas sp.]
MKRTMLLLTAAVMLSLPGCTAPGDSPGPVAAAPAKAATASALWNFNAVADALREQSCDTGGAAAQGLLPLELTVDALNARQLENLTGRVPAGARLAGAWELTAADPNFGGLSGLAVEDENTLLAVTDAGGWVRIGLAGGAPATAAIGYMRGADGRFLSGKNENDAEGLAYRDGLAFVSFERDFRIEAFAVGTCGAGAKAVQIAALPGAFEGHPIDPNDGPEALALTPEGHLVFGFEGASGSVSPLGHVRATGQAEWTGALAGNPSGFALVAMEAVALPGGETREISLYRAFDPLRGARSVLVWGAGETGRLTLSRPVLTDNFEGLAADLMESGDLRLWIVSDNNFSKLQRTLIYAFDITL